MRSGNDYITLSLKLCHSWKVNSLNQNWDKVWEPACSLAKMEEAFMGGRRPRTQSLIYMFYFRQIAIAQNPEDPYKKSYFLTPAEKIISTDMHWYLLNGCEDQTVDTSTVRWCVAFQQQHHHSSCATVGHLWWCKFSQVFHEGSCSLLTKMKSLW